MSIREKALRKALTQVGVVEEGRNNWGKQVSEYLKATGISFAAAWCMAFVHWCYEKIGMDFHHANLASVGFFASWADKMGWMVHTPMRGDIVCFNFNSDLWPDHVGFVVRRLGGLVYTVEGNTSSGMTGSQDDGGGVHRRVRSTSRCLFFRVPGDVKYQYEDKRNARKIYLRSWILRKRREGKSWKWIKGQPYAKEYYEVLGGK